MCFCSDDVVGIDLCIYALIISLRKIFRRIYAGQVLSLPLQYCFGV